MAPRKDQVQPPTKGAEPTLDPDNTGETAGAGVTKRKPPQQPTDDATKKPVQVEQFGRMVIDPTKLASDEELAKLPRTNLWTELTTGDPNAKPPRLPRISPDDTTKLHPGTKTFLQSLDCVHYPGDSGMLAIYDKNNYGGTKPILDLTAGNIVSIHREGDVNDPNYLKSTDHIDAVLKGAALSKMTNQPPGTPKDKATVVIDTPATESGGTPSLSKLIMAYAAEKTGLHAVGSDGNKIDTSKLPQDVKDKMDAEWGKMKDQYGFKSPTEAFNPVANPPSNGASSPTAKIDPKQPLSEKQIGDNAIAKATQRWANTDVKFEDRASVYTHLLNWAADLDKPGAKTPEAQAANHLHTALTSGGGNMDSAAIVKAVTDYQKELKAAGVKADAGGGTVEDISMTTQAFAAKNNIPGVDAKLYHQFQPADGLTNEQVGITTTAPVVQPPTPGAAPKQ